MRRPVELPRAGLRRQMLWLIGLRVAVVTVLLGSGLVLEIGAPGTVAVEPFFFLIGLTYALTLVYAATVRLAERHHWLIDVQLGADALTVSGVIYATGGIASVFPSLYALPIMAGSIFQRRRGGLTIATLSSLLYGGIVLAQYSGALEAVGAPGMDWALPTASRARYTVGLNTFGLLAVALLGGSLAESLQRTGAYLARASSQIADLQAFNAHVIESLPGGLATTDTTGRILSFNRMAETITGLTAGEAMGRPIAEVLQLPAGFAAGTDVPAQTGRRAEFAFTTRDGRQLTVGLSAAPVLTEGQPAGRLYTFQDLTRIKELEQRALQQQRLAAMGEMAAGIAHEIRNPLASMSGSIQILRHELELTPDQAQLLDIVLRESERLNDTIRSFLAYARPLRRATTRVDVHRLLLDTALLLRNSPELGEGHRVDVDPRGAGVVCDADEAHLRQIVWNLATNGLRAMPSGGRLRLSTSTGPSARGFEGGCVVIRVEDEGVGIAPEVMDGLFHPFRGAFAKGTGLGLAIVHRLVSDHGGDVQVSSRPADGTRVQVRFPAVAAVRAA